MPKIESEKRKDTKNKDLKKIDIHIATWAGKRQKGYHPVQLDSFDAVRASRNIALLKITVRVPEQYKFKSQEWAMSKCCDGF